MKDGTCYADEINFSATEFDDDLMECDVFCELVKGLDQEVVFDMAQRLTNILGQESLPAVADIDEDEEEEDDEEDDGSGRLSPEGSTGGHEDAVDAALLLRDRSLLLAGYTECMDEAIRYLVEEERYSAEHPLVLGLRQHLVDEQERVLGAAGQLDNARHGLHDDNNNNGGGGGAPGEPDVSLVALLAGTILNIRQPSL